VFDAKLSAVQIVGSDATYAVQLHCDYGVHANARLNEAVFPHKPRCSTPRAIKRRVHLLSGIMEDCSVQWSKSTHSDEKAGHGKVVNAINEKGRDPPTFHMKRLACIWTRPGSFPFVVRNSEAFLKAHPIQYGYFIAYRRARIV
jgi:hypothetical protein